MKKLITISVLVLAVLVLSTANPDARDRATTIYFTKNHSTTLYPKAECIGIVATETIPARKRDNVTWRVKSGHGTAASDDACTDASGSPMDKSQVQLRFMTNVMGVTMLTSDANGKISGTVSMNATEASPGAHKYVVLYKGEEAGPDPEIEIDCVGCGPDGGGPGGGN